MKRELAQLRQAIEKAETATAAMQALPTRTPDDEKLLAEGLAALQAARERAAILERFAEGAYVPDVAEEP